MDGEDWLRTQLTSFGCAACGSRYDTPGIRVLAQRDGLFFVDLACDLCGSAATAMVTVTQEEDAAPRATDPELAPATITRAGATPVRSPVDLDDVLDVHALLMAWEGDMVGLLRRLDGAEGSVPR